MARSLTAFGIVAAVLSVGCVPVTEQAGDVEKAEPDKELVGAWSTQKSKSTGIAALIKVGVLTIDAPEVKGNPKGLMRGVMKSDDDTESEVWFFCTTVEKHTYASLIMDAGKGKEVPKFDKEGAFAKWKKEPIKPYLVARYARDGDKLTLDYGNNEVFNKLMKDEKIKGDGNKVIELYSTPAGWFAEYFGKNAPDKVFDGTNMIELKREKK
jgi:hypothetical protein